MAVTDRGKLAVWHGACHRQLRQDQRQHLAPQLIHIAFQPPIPTQLTTPSNPTPLACTAPQAAAPSGGGWRAGVQLLAAHQQQRQGRAHCEQPQRDPVTNQ